MGSKCNVGSGFQPMNPFPTQMQALQLQESMLRSSAYVGVNVVHSPILHLEQSVKQIWHLEQLLIDRAISHVLYVRINT